MSGGERDEYLWDPGAAPDPADADARVVRRLEAVLGRHRFRPEPFRAETPPNHRSRARRLRLLLPLVVAAAAALLLWWRPFAPRGAGYPVEGVRGVRVAREGDRLQVGERAARMVIADLGEVTLEPGSVVRIEDAGERAHSLFFERGELHARITAAPRAFQVDSPAGLTVDLGCEYRLTVEASGALRLSVLSGQVAFGWGGREAYVPAGASCSSTPAGGPTPPTFDDMAPERRELLAALLAGDGGPASKGGYESLVRFEDRDDALPLFAVLFDPGRPRALREAIHARFEAVFRRPPAATRERVLACDPEARAAWLDVLRPWWRRQ